MLPCSKCDNEQLPENLMTIESETKTYYYCRICLKQAQDTLNMLIFKNKENRQLLKRIRKFLKHEKN